MGKPRTLEKGPHWEFGDRVKEAFANAGYEGASYEKIGKMIGLNASAVGKIYNGHNAASYETIAKIAKVTNANFEYLATGRGKLVYSLTGSIIDISDVPAEKRDTFRAIVQEMIKTTK
jgi:transcriptional regulator with XRE-family HTH domain